MTCRAIKAPLERLGAGPDACLYAGDGSSGELTGAGAAGMCPVFLRVSIDDNYRRPAGRGRMAGPGGVDPARVAGVTAMPRTERAQLVA